MTYAKAIEAVTTAIDEGGLVDEVAAAEAEAPNPKRPKRRRRTRPRSKTIGPRHLQQAVRIGRVLADAFGEDPSEHDQRPKTRGDCAAVMRPCPWVSCKHHLYLDVNPETGAIKINFPDLDPWELKHSCSLDVADAGALTLEEIGLITNLTRERVRQIEVRGLMQTKQHGSLRDVADD